MEDYLGPSEEGRAARYSTIGRGGATSRYDDDDDVDGIYIMMECISISNEKVTTSWIVDDDDIHIMMALVLLEQPSLKLGHVCQSGLGRPNKQFLEGANAHRSIA